MNRAERRKNKLSAQKPKTYVLTEDQIEKIKLEATRDAVRKAFLMFMSIPVMILHDKFGFDKIQLGRFMDYALIWYESVQENETHLLELVRIAQDECGINTITYNNSGGHQ